MMADRQITQADVHAAVGDFKDPESGRSAIQMEQIRDIVLQDNSLTLTLALTTHSAPIWGDTQQALQRVLADRLPQLASIQVNLTVHQRAARPLGEIGLTAKSVIAVGSGKGGVGKSTVAANFALSLKRAGCRVGLMDADVYGPSIPHLLGVSDAPQIIEKRIQPVDINGLSMLSMGLLVPKDEPVIWRGPMLHGAITQLLRDANWGELDYLIIDMPPGTGDVALTLAQLLPLSGIIVCTPQDVALLDAVKAIGMFRKVKIRVLGMIENMSGFVCPDCQKRYNIFGSGGAQREAEKWKVPFLGDIPINIQIRERGDGGTTDTNLDDANVAPYFEKIVHQVVKNLAKQTAEEPPSISLPVLG